MFQSIHFNFKGWATNALEPEVLEKLQKIGDGKMLYFENQYAVYFRQNND